MNPELRTIKFPGVDKVYDVKKSNVYYFNDKESFQTLIDSGNGNIGDIAIFSTNIYENEVGEALIYQETEGWIPLLSGILTDSVIYKNGKTLTEILDESLFKEEEKEEEKPELYYLRPTFFMNGEKIENGAEILIGKYGFTYQYETNVDDKNIDHKIFNILYAGRIYHSLNDKIVTGHFNIENNELEINLTLSLDADDEEQIFQEDEFILNTQLPTFIQANENFDIKNWKLLKFGESSYEINLNSEDNKLFVAIPYSINVNKISFKLETNGIIYDITKLIKTEQKFLEFGFGEKRYNVYSYIPDAVYKDDIYRITIERGVR